MRLDNRKDLLLLLLYSPGKGEAPNEPVVGRTRLVKMLFLFKEEALPHFQQGTRITSENFYQFFPWDFGPFSTGVYDDLTFFILHGFIEASESNEAALPESAEEWQEWVSSAGLQEEEDTPLEYREEVFRLTDRGMSFAVKLYGSLSSSQKKTLKEFKKRSSSPPLRALLRYVYRTYPDMASRSTIAEEISEFG